MTTPRTTRSRSDIVIGSGAATRTAAITVQKAAIVGETVVIKGKALQGITPIPLTRIEVSIRNKDFLQNEHARAPAHTCQQSRQAGHPDYARPARMSVARTAIPFQASPERSSMTRVRQRARSAASPPHSRGLNETERNLAVAGDTSGASWQAVDAAGNTLGLTIYEASEFKRSGDGRLPARAWRCDRVRILRHTRLRTTRSTSSTPSFLPRTSRSSSRISSRSPREISSARKAGRSEPTCKSSFVVRIRTIRTIRTGSSSAPRAARPICCRGVSMLEVNHPGGVCWSGQTPDLRDGDRLDVFEVVNEASSSVASDAAHHRRQGYRDRPP